MRDSELDMLAFFAVRGVKPNDILRSGALTRRFYYHAMEMYYKERNELIEILVKVLGGGK